jgi:uncharacterized protein with HEPN domain
VAFRSRDIKAATCTAVRWNAPQIVSEAAKALPPDYLARYPAAPWTSIVGIGNILRHEHQRLDDNQLWGIATVHLPNLQPIVAQMLTELGE